MGQLRSFYNKANDFFAWIELRVEHVRIHHKVFYYPVAIIIGLLGWIGASPIYYMFTSLHVGWLMNLGRALAIIIMVGSFILDVKKANRRAVKVSLLPWLWVLGFMLFFIFVVQYAPRTHQQNSTIPDYILYSEYWSTNIAAQYEKTAEQRSQEYDGFFKRRSAFNGDMIKMGTQAFICQDYKWSARFFKQADDLDKTDNAINQFYPFYAASLTLSGKSDQGTNIMEHLVQKIKADIASGNGAMGDAHMIGVTVRNIGIVTEVVDFNPDEDSYFLAKASEINNLQKRLSR